MYWYLVLKFGNAPAHVYLVWYISHFPRVNAIVMTEEPVGQDIQGRSPHFCMITSSSSDIDNRLSAPDGVRCMSLLVPDNTDPLAHTLDIQIMTILFVQG